ncbi:ribose-5-phosphate isomerase RpiA [Natranaeroarchaeum sulfidigenes]|nr:ribose-5-phosphate isomerase RpiA [Natranaeroarchaeum sulfidigenes]
MKNTGGSRGAKRRAGEHAATAVEDGMVVGLGTGSTAAHAIRAIGDQIRDGLDVEGVPTSFQARQLAIEEGIPVVDLDEVPGVDLAIDGADQISDGQLIKGGGGAHAREKVVDAAADRFLVVADPSKRAETLDGAVPVETLPAARPVVEHEIRALGGEPSLRRAERKDGPVITDNGNVVLDCEFGPIETPDTLAEQLSMLPGVVEHGLFVNLADEIHIGTAEGVTVERL